MHRSSCITSLIARELVEEIFSSLAHFAEIKNSDISLLKTTMSTSVKQ